MSFFDGIYMLAGFAVLIILALTFNHVFDVFMPKIQDDLPVGANETLTRAMDRTTNFLDTSFIALFFIFSAVVIGLTVFLISHPVGLAIFLMMQIVTIMVWDSLDTLLTGIEASAINGGEMDTALAFFHGDMPKAIVIINILLGAVMFGRRAYQ